MKIEVALPQKKLLDYSIHFKSDEFKFKRDKAIAEIQALPEDSLPVVWFGYGKDGSALVTLFNLAGRKYKQVTVNCHDDLPQHYAFWSEMDEWLGNKKQVVYSTELRHIDYLKKYLAWGKKNHLTKKRKKGEIIDFFDQGDVEAIVDYEIYTKYLDIEAQPGSILCWGNKNGEQMSSFYEWTRNGEKSLYMEKGTKHWRFVPISTWRDRDVWALLIEQGAPCSPIYSMHQLPQHGGKLSFPRTGAYCSCYWMNDIYFKWLARYAPVQLREMCDFFPEILLKLQKTN
ncbi:MAG: hypothetical protein ACRC78_03125 [Planktothrix sp.]